MVFVTITAFMVGGGGFAVPFEFVSGGFSARFGCFGWYIIFWFGTKRILWLFR